MHSRGSRTLHEVKRIHHHAVDAAAPQIGAVEATNDAARGIGQENGQQELPVKQI